MKKLWRSFSNNHYPFAIEFYVNRDHTIWNYDECLDGLDFLILDARFTEFKSYDACLPIRTSRPVTV